MPLLAFEVVRLCVAAQKARECLLVKNECLESQLEDGHHIVASPGGLKGPAGGTNSVKHRSSWLNFVLLTPRI